MILILTGFFILISQTMIFLLSHSFVFGVGHAERPIISFLVLELLSFAAYFLAIERVRRLTVGTGSNRFLLTWIFFIAILCRLVLFPSQMIQETDPYRYIWDGQTVIQNANPYQYAPQEALEKRLTPSAVEMNEAKETFRKINHSGIRTIYPPLAQFLFAISQWLSPWKLTGWRFMIFTAEILILLLMAAYLKKTGMREEWVLLYGWSPLVLKEFSNSLHVDVFAILFLCLMIYSITCDRKGIAYFALALATLVKSFTLVLLPLLFVWTWKKGKSSAILGTISFVLVLTLFYLPFLDAGWAIFDALGRFASEWRVNDGLFGLIHFAVGAGTIFGRVSVNLMSRIVAAVFFFGLIGFVLRWLKGKEDTISFFKACLISTAGLFFLAPTGNPWYSTWVLPFLFFLPLRSLLFFSGLVFLYYLDFYFFYHSKPELFDWVKTIEYGLFYPALGLELWKRYQKYPLFYRLQTNVVSSATH